MTKSNKYDEAFQKYVRGEASLQDVWNADPYDSELRKMAQNAMRREAPANRVSGSYRNPKKR